MKCNCVKYDTCKIIDKIEPTICKVVPCMFPGPHPSLQGFFDWLNKNCRFRIENDQVLPF